MTSDITSREVSQRLMDVGFKAGSDSGWRDTMGYGADAPEWRIIHNSVSHYDAHSSQIIPAYSASTLFEWLRQNFWEPDVKFFEIQEDGIYLASFDDSESTWIEYTSLPDMLAESIIWILTQEKENK